jgi:hypothetical protein
MVPPPDMAGFLTLSLVSGITAVLLTGNIRMRGQLLRAGILTGVVTLVIAIMWGRLDVGSCFGIEAVNHLDDLLLRRFRLGILLADGGQSLLPALQPLIKKHLGWGDERWVEEAERYRRVWSIAYGLPKEW